MIATDNFVYIHTSRHAGTFLNKLILQCIPNAHGIQYHGHLSMLPENYSHLPVIGFVRNPWDWYVSMYVNYRKKGQYIFRIISEDGRLNFEETVTRYLLLGDKSALSNSLLNQLIKACPIEINKNTNPKICRPALTSSNFSNYALDCGYYSWLFQLMFASNKSPKIHIGRFEDLQQEIIQLLIKTNTPITEQILQYVDNSPAINTSERDKSYKKYYSNDLKALVEEKEKYIIENYSYTF